MSAEAVVGVAEVWRPVAECPLYEVSDHGRVRRGAKVLRTPCGGPGYPLVSLCWDGAPRKRLVHDLVASAFLGPRPAGAQVNHRDGVKRHNMASNLEYVTPAENMRHAVRTGLHHRGERTGSARLAEAQVRELRTAAPTTHAQRCAFAERFGVAVGTIVDAAIGRTWRHVEPERIEPKRWGAKKAARLAQTREAA